jgi:thiol-disulfide isomerase/thioredoxin
MYLTPVEEEEKKASISGVETVSFADAQGNRHDLGEYLDKPVFINYWATWCPPCRAEMPGLEKLYQQYGDQIHFLFISNQSLSKQRAFIRENDYDLPYYQLASRPGGTFQYSVLPTSLIISEDDRVVLRKEGAVNWQSKNVRAIFDRVASSD